MGGMGNQMFQYAVGRSLSTHLKTGLKFDLNHLLNRTPVKNVVFRNYDLDVFNLTTERATQREIDLFLYQSKNKWARLFKNLVINRIDPHPVFREPHFHFTPRIYELPQNSYLAGYWQSPKYFENIKDSRNSKFRYLQNLSVRRRKSICRGRKRKNNCIFFMKDRTRQG